MKFTIYQESRIGKRSNNEDRLAHCYSRDALLIVLADGMGGHYYGEIAAQIAVQTLVERFQREASPCIADPFAFLNKSMLSAHCAILDYVDDHNLTDSPRTTCVACIVQNGAAYWAHAGDSRLYHMRNGNILAKTVDHSRVQLLIDRGEITPEQAAYHPDRNKVYSCLGGQQLPEIALSKRTALQTGDILLLCSDGLWGVTPESTLAQAFKEQNPMRITPLLLDHNEKLGGPNADNYSIVVVRWEDSQPLNLGDDSDAISTQTMSLDMVTTRLDEFGRNANYKTELSEDEIERAIEEIRSTIQKYSK